MAKEQVEQTAEETAAAEKAEEAVKPTETKREAFVRLASKRVTNISHAIKLLHPLTNKANYDYLDAHWKAVFEQISKDMNELVEAVQGVKKGPAGFDLSSIADEAAPAEQPKA